MVNYKEILFPYVKEREDKLNRENKCFAHYTSAENAINIIKTSTLWMRKASLMNDTQELILGKEILLEHLRQKNVQARLSEILRDFSTNIDWDNLLNIIANDEFKTMRNNTYLSSLTEIDENDNNGLLSMWRGYGHNNGVALVFKRDIIEMLYNNIPLYFFPVLYTRKENTISTVNVPFDLLEANFNIICSGDIQKRRKYFLYCYIEKIIKKNLSFLTFYLRNDLKNILTEYIDKEESELERVCQDIIAEKYKQIHLNDIIRNIKIYYENNSIKESIEDAVKEIFYLSIISIKHAGFSEEAEWRILFDERKNDCYDPKLISVECINSIPQKVCKMSFDRYYHCDLRHLLHKIIIGPCANSEIVKEAFIETMEEKGFFKPEDIIQISDIPLRT